MQESEGCSIPLLRGTWTRDFRRIRLEPRVPDYHVAMSPLQYIRRKRVSRMFLDDPSRLIRWLVRTGKPVSRLPIIRVLTSIHLRGGHRSSALFRAGISPIPRITGGIRFHLMSVSLRYFPREDFPEFLHMDDSKTFRPRVRRVLHPPARQNRTRDFHRFPAQAPSAQPSCYHVSSRTALPDHPPGRFVSPVHAL